MGVMIQHPYLLNKMGTENPRCFVKFTKFTRTTVDCPWLSETVRGSLTSIITRKSILLWPILISFASRAFLWAPEFPTQRSQHASEKAKEPQAENRYCPKFGFPLFHPAWDFPWFSSTNSNFPQPLLWFFSDCYTHSWTYIVGDRKSRSIGFGNPLVQDISRKNIVMPSDTLDRYPSFVGAHVSQWRITSTVSNLSNLILILW